MFKVGDTVKCIKDSYNKITPGSLGTVTFAVKDGCAVRFSDYINVMLNTELELVSAEIKGELTLPVDDQAVLGAGTKNDQSKPDLSLIPTDALWGTAAALSYGAKKYARHNFRKGIQYSRLVAAAMRHLTAWNEGEDVDSESSLSHLDHAMASLAMLKFMAEHRPEMDDRYKIEAKAGKEVTKENVDDVVAEAVRRGR